MQERFPMFVIFVCIFGRLTITHERGRYFFPTIVSHFTTNFNMVVVYSGSSTNFAVWQAHIPKNLGALLQLPHHVYLIMFVSTIVLTRALLCMRPASVIFRCGSGYLI